MMGDLLFSNHVERMPGMRFVHSWCKNEKNQCFNAEIHWQRNMNVFEYSQVLRADFVAKSELKCAKDRKSDAKQWDKTTCLARVLARLF